jgi:hypothetical protein
MKFYYFLKKVKVFNGVNKYKSDAINNVVLSGIIYDKNIEKFIFRKSHKEYYIKSVATIIFRQEDINKRDIYYKGRVNFFIVKAIGYTCSLIEKLPIGKSVLIRGMIQTKISRMDSEGALSFQQGIFIREDDKNSIEIPSTDHPFLNGQILYKNIVELSGRIYQSPGERYIILKSPEEKFDDDPHKIRTVIKFWELPKSKGKSEKYYAQVSFAIQVGKTPKSLDNNASVGLFNIILCEWKPNSREEFNENKKLFLQTNRSIFVEGILLSKKADGYNPRVIVSKIKLPSEY